MTTKKISSLNHQLHLNVCIFQMCFWCVSFVWCDSLKKKNMVIPYFQFQCRTKAAATVRWRNGINKVIVSFLKRPFVISWWLGVRVLLYSSMPALFQTHLRLNWSNRVRSRHETELGSWPRMSNTTSLNRFFWRLCACFKWRNTPSWTIEHVDCGIVQQH